MAIYSSREDNDLKPFDIRIYPMHGQTHTCVYIYMHIWTFVFFFFDISCGQRHCVEKIEFISVVSHHHLFEVWVSKRVLLLDGGLYIIIYFVILICIIIYIYI